MVTGNRPYSGNDVFSSLLRRGVGKSAVDKALDQLVKENKIVVKLNGKQKRYCVGQPAAAAADQEEIQSIDEELSKTNEALREVLRKYAQSEAELKKLRRTCSLDEAQRRVAELEKTVSELKSRLEQALKDFGDVSAEDRERVKENYEMFAREYRKRKRICTDMLDSILEGCSQTKMALFESMGIETDESVNMPSL